MIDAIDYIARNGIIINGITDGVGFNIRFTDVQSYWSYATENDFEGGIAKVFGERILFTMLTFSGQGGIVVLWNVNKRKIEHISECSYSIAIDMCGNKIYSLHYISCYDESSRLALYEVPCGIMDAFQEGKQLDIELTDVLEDFDGRFCGADLKVENKKITIVLNGKEHVLTMV